MKIFNPAVFQGNISKRNYFEGWYLKHVSKYHEHVYSFIPGVSLNPENPHAFIQVINGVTGITQYIEYPLSAFSFNKKHFEVQIGESIFSENFMLLQIDSAEIKVHGRLSYSASIKYPSSLLSPGIMGWYSFVPFMECKHGIVSVTHRIDGSLIVNSLAIDFSGGKGYIEKDWGKSFPESWIWLQSNNFEKTDASIMMSIAKIPWLGKYFTGFLGFLFVHGQFYTFSTYNKSEIAEISLINEQLTLTFKNKDYSLKIKAHIKNSGILRAPQLGKMTRHIKESVDSELEIELHANDGKIIYFDKAYRAGLEVIEGIFDIVKVKA